MDRSDSTKMTRLDKLFGDRKEEIHQVYCKEGKPLREAMEFFEQQYGLKASMRKWKSKLKDWRFDKYSKAEEMAFIASKMQNRKAEGKDTVFFLGDKQVTEETTEKYMRRRKVNAEEIMSPAAETPANISYCTPEPEVDINMKIIEEALEDTDYLFIAPINYRNNSPMPVLLKAGGKIRILDASQEHEPDRETIDMLAKIACPSWKEFRIRMLLISNCTQDLDKAPLFAKQNSTTTPPRKASPPPQESSRGGRGFQESSTMFDTTQPANTSRDGNGSRLYVYKEAKDDNKSGESLADPLHQSHGADDAPDPKTHTFFRFPLGEGNVFQIVPESEAQLLPPEDVGSFIGLKDRNLDVTGQVASAIGILNSTGPELRDDSQPNHPDIVGDLACDIEAIGGEHETGEQEIRNYDPEDWEMEDVNSNPVGVTYTESCMTGISWDYSALFP